MTKNPETDTADEVSILKRLHGRPGCAFFTPEESARYLNLSRDRLRSWRWSGRGPKWIGRNHFIRYRKADLDEFLANERATDGEAA